MSPDVFFNCVLNLVAISTTKTMGNHCARHYVEVGTDMDHLHYYNLSNPRLPVSGHVKAMIDLPTRAALVQGTDKKSHPAAYYYLRDGYPKELTLCYDFRGQEQVLNIVFNVDKFNKQDDEIRQEQIW